jgi:SAM-dependent methyltransferase
MPTAAGRSRKPSSHHQEVNGFNPALISGDLLERRLSRLAIDLGAERVGGRLSEGEARLITEGREEVQTDRHTIERIEAAILLGEDPLGAAIYEARSAVMRRSLGAFFTPPELVEPMLDWTFEQGFDCLVDPGCGSGRFVAGAVRRRPNLHVIAIDIDPLSTLFTRAALRIIGASSATVLNANYTSIQPSEISGRTAFVGNPPYVRHHDLTSTAKDWMVAGARRLGYKASALAGLHAHFFLATALLGQPGDIGCFVTSSEWLDVNYGSIIRSLLLDGLGCQALYSVDPHALPFDETMTTALITCFAIGTSVDTWRVREVERLDDLGSLSEGSFVARSAFAKVHRWSPLVRRLQNDSPLDGGVPLRTIARVHRGAVTGANDFFILSRERARQLGVDRWCRPAITSAEEILKSSGCIRDLPTGKLLLDVPKDVNRADHPELDAYLRLGEQPWNGGPPVSKRYIPSHRRPWWWLGLPHAPPIVATYMARQAPVFAVNPNQLALVNIGHGLYPVRNLNTDESQELVRLLNSSRDSFRGRGRTYHGGLEKFEPREMENLPIAANGAWLR